MMVVTSQLQREAPVRSAGRARSFLLVRLLVVGVVYALIFRVVDLSQILQSLSERTAWAFGIGVLLLLSQIAICAERWRLLVPSGTPRPGFKGSFWAYLEGSFFNQALPSTIGGDAVRVLRWRSRQMPAAEAFGTVLVDRISGAIGAALLAGMASVLLVSRDVGGYRSVAVLALSAAVLFGGLCFVALMRWPPLKGLLRHVDRIHPSIQQARGALVLGRSFVFSLAYSVAGHCLAGIAVYAFARSLGADLPLRLGHRHHRCGDPHLDDPDLDCGLGPARGELLDAARADRRGEQRCRPDRHPLRSRGARLGAARRALAPVRLDETPGRLPRCLASMTASHALQRAGDVYARSRSRDMGVGPRPSHVSSHRFIAFGNFLQIDTDNQASRDPNLPSNLLTSLSQCERLNGRSVK